LRLGVFDVLVGVNLLREGLDLPEVSLVAVLDADKEGFLRSNRSLTQTAGRAARNLNGKVIMYADKITESMQQTMDETDRRRAKQIEYNLKNNITPQALNKNASEGVFANRSGKTGSKAYVENDQVSVAADPVVQYMSLDQLQKALNNTRRNMEKAAKELDFIEAARYRDEMFQLEKLYKEKA
jgi:excinuclease ABC subunit B